MTVSPTLGLASPLVTSTTVVPWTAPPTGGLQVVAKLDWAAEALGAATARSEAASRAVSMPPASRMLFTCQ